MLYRSGRFDERTAEVEGSEIDAEEVVHETGKAFDDPECCDGVDPCFTGRMVYDITKVSGRRMRFSREATNDRIIHPGIAQLR